MPEEVKSVSSGGDTIEQKSHEVPQTPETGGEQTTPEKKEPEVKTVPAAQEPEKAKPSVPIQERINRMYARMKSAEEENKKLKTQNELLQKNTATPQKPAEATDYASWDTEAVDTKGMSQEDVQRIIKEQMAQQKLREEYEAAEREVLVRHPEAVNEDGTLNMEDPFMKKYIEVGRREAYLASLRTGPILAEAQAERELGIHYKKGRVDEAQRLTQQGVDNFSATSTVGTPPVTSKVELNENERSIARKMGLSDEEYAHNKTSKQVQTKNWEVT